MDIFFFLSVYFVEGVIVWRYCNALFTRKRPLWFCIFSTVVGYGTAWGLFNLSFVWLNVLFFTLVNLSLLLICFRCSWKTAFFHSGILTSLMFGSEMVVEFVLGKIFGGFQQYQSNIMVFTTLFAFSKLLFLGASKICIFLTNKRKGENQRPGPAVLFLACFPIATILILIVIAYAALALPLPKGIETMMVIGSIILILSNLLIFIGYQYDQRLNQDYLALRLTQQKDEAEENYFKALEEHYDHQRILIHDIRRHLIAIREMAEETSNASILEYVSNIEASPALQRKVHYCPNPMLNIVLSHCAELCEKKGIAFFPDVRNISTDFLSPGDITSLFGNLLENALEAAEGAESPVIELRAGRHRNSSLVLSLVNSCKEEPKTDSFGRFLSRKPNKAEHGIGLKSIQNTVNKYHGIIQQHYDTEKKQFHTTLLLQ